MSKIIPLYSKSSVGTDNTCHRKYFHAYKAGGTGIQARGQAIELFMGSALHDGLACIAQDEMEEAKTNSEDRGNQIGIDTIAKTAFKQVLDPMIEAATNRKTGQIEQDDVDYAREQATLVEGLLRGFYRHVWPRLMEEYDIEFFEKPMIFKHDGIGMVVKADLVVRSKSTGMLTYVEYKSTSSKDDRWIRSWDTNIQLHSSVRAIEQAVGEEVESVIVIGLYKGYFSYNKQGSPFCYGYKKNGNPPFTTEQLGYKYLAGWNKTPTWMMPDGVKGWVAKMPEEILQEQFPQTPPIFLNRDLIDAFFRQQAVRQRLIQYAQVELDKDILLPEARQLLMDEVFPQNFEECTPAWGGECNYRILCHGPQVDPLTLGFQSRTTDHMQPFYEVLENDKSE